MVSPIDSLIGSSPNKLYVTPEIINFEFDKVGSVYSQNSLEAGALSSILEML